jgi:Tfp pilus assembly protein PilX
MPAANKLPMPRCRQSGAALVVSLAFASAVAILAVAAMREIALDTAITANLSARTHARLATLSGIESMLAESSLPESGETTRTFLFGPHAEFETSVVVRYLGEQVRYAFDTTDSANPTARYYEIVAQTHGPRNTSVERRIYWFVRVPDSL